MRTGEQAPPPPALTALHPLGEKETISCGNRFDWKFERVVTLSSSPWRGEDGFPSTPPFLRFR